MSGRRERRGDPGASGRTLQRTGAVTLARALSKFGVCSRSEAARRIADGRVRVNGQVERSASRWIDPCADRVVVDGRRVGDSTPRVVLAFHKPAGVVTTRADPDDRPTVYDALGDVGRWVFPVGRLDRDSSGLLILTNDHRLGERLTSPEQHVPKTYHARVRGRPSREVLRALREGVVLDDASRTRPARVRVLEAAPEATAVHPVSTWLEIVLSEGRNRQIRRMGTAVGHAVLDLVRVRIGRLELGDLAPGEWRELDSEEVRRLEAGGRPPMPGTQR